MATLLARSGSGKPGETSGKRGLDRACVFGRHDSLLLAALQVQVDPAEPDGIGPRARPIDVPQHIAGRLPPDQCPIQRQKAVIEEPLIQMNAALKAVESVVGERDEERLIVAVLECLADDRRRSGDKRRQSRWRIGVRGLAAIGRMIALAESPE